MDWLNTPQGNTKVNWKSKKNVFRERMIGIIIACRRPLVRKKISYSSTLSLLPIGLSPVDGRFVLSVDEALLWLGGVFASTLSITLIPSREFGNRPFIPWFRPLTDPYKSRRVVEQISYLGSRLGNQPGMRKRVEEAERKREGKEEP